MLEAIFDECVDEPVARAVLVTAPAGLGKSRLRHEFLRRIARGARPTSRCWSGRGDPMSAGSPFGMLAQAIRRAAGVADGEPLDVRRQKLRARVARRVAPRPSRARVTEFLGELVGAPFPDDERRAAPRARARTRCCWATRCAARSRTGSRRVRGAAGACSCSRTCTGATCRR